MRSGALLRRPSAWSHDYRDATALDALTPTESTRRLLIPSHRLLLGLTVLFACALLVWLVPALAAPWIAMLVVFVAVAGFDALQLLRVDGIEATRAVPGSVPVGVSTQVAVRIVNRSRAAQTVTVFDHHPAHANVEGLPRQVRLEPNSWARIRYALRPLQRGDLQFGRVEARIASPLALWQMRQWLGDSQSIRVFPNFAALARYALFATDHRLAQIGILQRRRRGEGMEFQQLREYRLGDPLRSIDWRASARTAKLISRDYHDERSQQIVFLLDCGRRMSAQDGALSHFDHMLNAALLLAHVGLRQGDAVGLLTMATEAQGATRYLAPRRAASTVNSILNCVYDLAPTSTTPDYYRAAQEFSRRVSKRALVVILTNLRDEDDDDLLPALRLLQSRHLVVLASLREQILGETLARPVRSFDQALTHGATAGYLHRRAASFARLERQGVIALDVEPARLAIALVNRYLDVKRSGRL